MRIFNNDINIGAHIENEEISSKIL